MARRKEAPAAPLQVEMVSIDSVIPDPANAMTHPERNLDVIKASLARFGQQVPIVVDPKGIIRKGNGTHAAAKALGWDEIAIVRSTLEGVDATAFAIVDNRSAQLARWDYEALAPQILALRDEGVNLESLGWAPHEVEPILGAEWTPAAPGALDQGPPSGAVIKCTKPQRELFDRAREALAKRGHDPKSDDGQALALLCSHYLACKAKK